MTFEIQTALVTIATPELDRLIEFYTQLFGKEPVVHLPKVYGEFNIAGLRLGLFKLKGSNPPFESTAPGPISLCLEAADLEAAIAHVTKLGCAPVGSIVTADHGREVYVYDPVGNRLILYQRHQQA